MPGVVEAVYDLAKRNDRFIVNENLTKDQYYAILAQSSIQFSSALQDWVSFTCVEATMFGCDIVYPDFRSLHIAESSLLVFLRQSKIELYSIEV